jgi:hypothetical protein
MQAVGSDGADLVAQVFNKVQLWAPERIPVAIAVDMVTQPASHRGFRLANRDYATHVSKRRSSSADPVTDASAS